MSKIKPDDGNDHENDGDEEFREEIQEGIDAQTIALRVIAGLLIVGGASMLSKLLVPFVLAIVLSIALAPLAGRIERLGLGRVFASLACMALVGLVLLGTAGLLSYQAGTILQHSGRYLDRFSELLAEGSKLVGGDRLLTSIGMIDPGVTAGSEAEAEAAGDPISRPKAAGREPERRSEQDQGTGDDESRASSPSSDISQFWGSYLRRNLQSLGSWILGGIGGFVGIVGQIVVFLAFLFYMLATRSEWVDRIMKTTARLGLRPRRKMLANMQEQIRRFVLYLLLVSVSYAIIITGLGYLLGLPTPPLWGILAGLLEFIPYFGPLISGTLLTTVALASGGGWWQPVTVLGIYLVLQTIEGYVITPIVYGKAVQFNPVTVLFAVLFFGWLWGPLGLVAALPVMVLLRGLVDITPDTPALKALMEKSEAAAT